MKKKNGKINSWFINSENGINLNRWNDWTRATSILKQHCVNVYCLRGKRNWGKIIVWCNLCKALKSLKQSIFYMFIHRYICSESNM